MSDIYMTVEPNCEVGGHAIAIGFSGNVPTSSTWTLYRESSDGRDVVRGARRVSVGNTSISSFIDYEAPINAPVTYTVEVTNFGEETISVDPLTATCPITQYLRDMLDPDVYYISDFCLGTIESTESSVRSGVFSALGRSAPIVVVDSRSTETGTLRFVAKTQDQYKNLKRIFNRGTPLLIQIEQEYNLGKNGVLYFQPDKFTDTWLSPNAKLPYHTIEVSYTTIDAPSYATIFVKTGIPYDVAITPEPGFLITEGPLTGKSFCGGGLLQRNGTYDELFNSGMTYAEAYFAIDSCADGGGEPPPGEANIYSATYNKTYGGTDLPNTGNSGNAFAPTFSTEY